MKRIIFLFLLCSFNFLHSIVILVHGTFAVSEPWARPGGDFYDALEQTAKNHHHHLIPFAWSGGTRHADRIQAAQALAKVIISYPTSDEKILIGHSHGGNVIMLASQLLYNTMQLSSTKSSFSSRLKKCAQSINNLYKEMCNSPESIPTKTNSLHTINQLIDAHCSLYNDIRNNKHISSSHFLQRVYLLATPIDPILYKPEMDIIGHIFNFYSAGDMIQTVFGFYRRLFPDQERIVNFKIEMNTNSWFYSNNPSHWHLHHPVIAQHMLDIPYAFHQKGIYGFEEYEEKHNGKIVFDELGPHYTIDPKNTEERERIEREKELAQKEKVGNNPLLFFRCNVTT